ncbi:MAG: hypothetical protein A2289_01480 [Deltaproteobacteria bacterium RIFOXYA12_FULL_58_15]|nr:MAG: hypothetical protein A2289_01480 [Deltaproteobacteria bacterium RIFOXYA12_FULL_58_15]
MKSILVTVYSFAFLFGCGGEIGLLENEQYYEEGNSAAEAAVLIACNNTSACPAGSVCMSGLCSVVCNTDSVCPAGSVCMAGLCTDVCNTNSECPAGSVCMDGLCTDACSTNSECPAGSVCMNQLCTAVCSTNSECPAGSVCMDGLCTDACTTNSECPAGSVCMAGLCTDACTTNSDCPAGSVCMNSVCNDDFYATAWFDRDNPSGAGDYEGYQSVSPSPCQPGYSYFQTQRACVSGTCSNDIIHTYSTGGIYCLQAENSYGCGDWKVQFVCVANY